jgi:MipA family protein
MTVLSRTLSYLIPAALLLSAGAAPAQQPESKGWVVDIGPGALFRPKFPGAKDLELGFWPVIHVNRPGKEGRFAPPDDSHGPHLIGSKAFRIGPALRIESGRDEEDAIIGIGDVDTTVEGGAFAESYLSPNFRLRGEVRKGFGGHKGVIGDLGADFMIGNAEALQFSIGPRLRLANARYVRAFYGVNPAQSALTGLPVYDVDGGIHSAGALAAARYRLGPSWGLEAYGRYDRLLGDAKDSPLVLSSVGSRDQFEVGLGLSYRFTVR